LKIIKSYFTGIRSIGYPLVLLIFLVIADAPITNYLVGQGTVHELNPILRNLVGTHSFWVIKVIGALLCVLILWDIYRRHPKLALISSWCFVVAYLGIIIWNVSLFLFNR
jgi:hypothetical protein